MRNVTRRFAVSRPTGRNLAASYPRSTPRPEGRGMRTGLHVKGRPVPTARRVSTKFRIVRPHGVKSAPTATVGRRGCVSVHGSAPRSRTIGRPDESSRPAFRTWPTTDPTGVEPDVVQRIGGRGDLRRRRSGRKGNITHRRACAQACPWGEGKVGQGLRRLPSREMLGQSLWSGVDMEPSDVPKHWSDSRRNRDFVVRSHVACMPVLGTHERDVHGPLGMPS
jgi:hypothetical protein